MKTSSSVITVLMVGVRLEQAEIVVGSAFFFAFGTLAFNMSSQPDLNSKVKGRLLDEGDWGVIFLKSEKGAFFDALRKKGGWMSRTEVCGEKKHTG